MDTTPLEALTVGPDELLILRLPSGITSDMESELVDQVLVWASAADISNRVLVVSNEIELAKVAK